MSANVMVVDDDPAIQFTVQEILEDANLDVRIADSGSACLEALREGFKGVILMDVMMPEMDGWGTIKAMVEEGLCEGRIILMLTAVHDPGPELDCLKEYVLDYLRKPFTEDELTSAVTESLAYL